MTTLMLCDTVEQAARDTAWPIPRSTILIVWVIPLDILPLLQESWKLVSHVGSMTRDTRKANESYTS